MFQNLPILIEINNEFNIFSLEFNKIFTEKF